MKATYSILAASFFVFFLVGVITSNPVVAQPGAPAWRSSPYLAEFHIVVPANASPTLRLAGETFKKYWESATRRRISMSHINEGRTNVWLGAGAMSEDLITPERVAELTEEEYLIRTYTPPRRAAEQGAEKQLLIVGGGDAGVLHGVYAFSSRIIGVRWLAPGLTDYGSPLQAMVEHELRWRPEFSFREIGFTNVWDKDATEFRQAYALSARPLSSPGNPAYFDGMADSYASDGRPAYGAPEGAQLVLAHILDMARAEETNADALLLERRRVVQWQLPHATVWRLAAMDWLHPTLAPEGRALNEQEHSPAAAILALANEVAEGLADALPEEIHWVHVLLSPAMQAPPQQLRAHPGVIVQLSTRACNHAAPLTHRQCAANSRFVEQLVGWRALGARIHILEHMVNMGNPQLPFPHFQTIQPNLLFYARHDVEGLYYAGIEEVVPENIDLAELRLYLVASLLNDPDIIYQNMLEEFLSRYYRFARPEILEYISLLEQAVSAHGVFLSPDDPGEWLNEATLAEAEAIIARAMEKNLTDDIRARVAVIMNGLARLRAAQG